MILTCPECFTRYQADEAKFPPQGREVRCAKCGHLWHQDPPARAEEPVVAEPEPEFEPPPREEEPRPQAYVAPPAFDVAPQRAAAERAPAPKRASPWPRRIVLGAGWLVLGLLVAAIGWAAMTYRHEVVRHWPRSASLYTRFGVASGVSGLQIEDYHYRLEAQGGQTVLTVSGRVVNVSGQEMAVPQLHASLMDGAEHEIYHWSFAPAKLSLGAGQATHFVTRLSSPPGAARHLQLRFARQGE